MLDGLHYSLNELGDGCESFIGLSCKEGGFTHIIEYDAYLYSVLAPFTKKYKQGATYAQQYDLIKLEDF